MRDRYDESVVELDGEYGRAGKHKQRYVDYLWTVEEHTRKQIWDIYRKIDEFETSLKNHPGDQLEPTALRKKQINVANSDSEPLEMNQVVQNHMKHRRKHQHFRKQQTTRETSVLDAFDMDVNVDI